MELQTIEGREPPELTPELCRALLNLIRDSETNQKPTPGSSLKEKTHNDEVG